MKNRMATMLLEAKKNGVNQGLLIMELVTLIALDNVVRMREVSVDDTFFTDMEKEMKEIFDETIASVPSGEAADMAERLEFYVDEIRERRHMDD